MNVFQYDLFNTIVGKRTTILNNFGYQTIKEAKLDYPTKSNKDIYEILLKKYNTEAVKENKRIMNDYLIKKAILKFQNNKEKSIISYSILKQKEQERKQKQIQKRKDKRIINELVTPFIFTQQTEPYGQFVSLLKNKFINKNIIIDLVVDKKIIKTFNMTPTSPFKNWWEQIGKNEFEYPENIFIDYPTGRLYIYEGKHNLNKDKIIQYFKEGNVNCLLKGIINWAENKLTTAKSKTAIFNYNKILKNLNNLSIEIGDKGVNEELIVKICNDLQIDICIEYAIPIENQYLL